jgi:hypothetical protein
MQWTYSLGLINPAENLWRHNLPPLNRISSRDSTTRLEQHFLTGQGLQRWKIYSLIFLDSENSDRAEDTWGSPHCLNVVHEKAGDECVHEKLKEGKLADDAEIHRYKRPAEGLEHLHELRHGRRCRPKFFSRSSSGGCRRRRRNSLFGEWAEQQLRWLVAGWPKTSQRENQEWRHYRA